MRGLDKELLNVRDSNQSEKETLRRPTCKLCGGPHGVRFSLVYLEFKPKMLKRSNSASEALAPAMTAGKSAGPGGPPLRARNTTAALFETVTSALVLCSDDELRVRVVE